MDYFYVEAQPYGGGRSRYIGRVDRDTAEGMLRELYSGTQEATPTLGASLHCGVPRSKGHAGGLLTLTRTNHEEAI